MSVHLRRLWVTVIIRGAHEVEEVIVRSTVTLSVSRTFSHSPRRFSPAAASKEFQAQALTKKHRMAASSALVLSAVPTTAAAATAMRSTKRSASAARRPSRFLTVRANSSTTS